MAPIQNENGTNLREALKATEERSHKSESGKDRIRRLTEKPDRPGRVAHVARNRWHARKGGQHCRLGMSQ